MSAAVIRVGNISKTFGPVHAVRDLSFEVEPATCFGLLGPNGAGKTTMMKMIYARSPRDRDCGGTMDIFGFDPRTQELQIKCLAGVVPQEDSLDDELNVVGNLMIYARFYSIPRAEALRRIEALLTFMELSERRHAKIRELSGGMKRRLVIARALLNNPRLLILDEPTTGLDPQVRHVIWDKLRLLKRQGTTILLTTHYMDEAFVMCDNLIIMDKGEAIVQGSPAELLERNIEAFVLEVDSNAMETASNRTLPAGVRVDHSHETMRLFSNDVDGLRAVADTLARGHHIIRRSNLEDVFLKETGRLLNEIQ
ncbi:MAG: ABC transporter ATP-binding protein [Phycisphaerae bacterium]|nr:ABC transporter ATP-binding protein [Phycisphaerae bacterium]